MKLRLLLAGCILLAPATGRADDVGKKIVEFCRENKDKAVGDGDCYDLGKYALHAAGAKPQFKNKDFPAKGDYVWGELVALLEGAEKGPKWTSGGVKDIKPGDVVQFRDTQWEGPRASGKERYTATLKHHTAIVDTVADGKVLKFYHQNVGGKKVVMEGSLKLDDLAAGWIRVYRPSPK